MKNWTTQYKLQLSFRGAPHHCKTKHGNTVSLMNTFLNVNTKTYCVFFFFLCDTSCVNITKEFT